MDGKNRISGELDRDQLEFVISTLWTCLNVTMQRMTKMEGSNSALAWQRDLIAGVKNLETSFYIDKETAAVSFVLQMLEALITADPKDRNDDRKS